jgi:hypothetical protein
MEVNLSGRSEQKVRHRFSLIPGQQLLFLSLKELNFLRVN